jgi:hypothetical protein
MQAVQPRRISALTPLRETGNLAAVMKSMGHANVRTAMKYKHADLNVLRDALISHENSGELPQKMPYSRKWPPGLGCKCLKILARPSGRFQNFFC